MSKKSRDSRAKQAESEVPAGPVDHIIEVRVEMASFQLVVEHPRAIVKPGDSVIWVFRGLPSGWLPSISFPEHGPFGPFPGLHVSGGAVWGTIPADTPPAALDGLLGAYGYRASVRTGLGIRDYSYGALLRSPWADLEVRDLNPKNLRAVVSYDVELGSLRISNPLIKRNQGDTVEWLFEVPRKVLGAGTWQPRIDFFRFDSSSSAAPENLSLGPFSSVEVKADSVLGMGDNSSPGIYSYVALVVARDTGSVRLASTPDPVIDDRGQVADPSGGG